MSSKAQRNLIKTFLVATAAVCCPSQATPPQENAASVNAPFQMTISFEQPFNAMADTVSLETAYKPAIPFPELKNTYINCDKDKHAAIVIKTNGEFVYGSNIDSLRYPASLAKLMTLLLAFEELDKGNWQLNDRMDTRIERRLWKKWVDRDLVVMGISPTERFKFKQAILGVGIYSAADAAEILAKNIAGSTEKFVERMNLKAAELGMVNTHFTNPSGFPDTNQVTTAKDMAKLMLKLSQASQDQQALLKTKEFLFHGKRLKNHAIIPGAIWGKTGVINASGSNTFLLYPDYIIGVLGGKSGVLRNREVNDLWEATKHYMKPGKTYLTDAVDDTSKLAIQPMLKDNLQIGMRTPVLHMKEMMKKQGMQNIPVFKNRDIPVPSIGR